MKTLRTTLLSAAMLCLMALSATAKTTPADDKAAIIADWERAKAYTLEYIDAMSEEAFFKSPTDGIRTFAGQMLHIADGNAGIMGIATGKPGPFQGRVEQDATLDTKAKVRATVVTSYDAAIAALKEFDMSKSAEAAEAFGMSFPRSEWIKKAFEHQTHHRGQCTIYLRMAGIAPPPEKLF
uniref:DinB family protein n=1 Tax=Roseivirga sp. TaxID=1964215 RepID=UPI004047ED5F